MSNLLRLLTNPFYNKSTTSIRSISRQSLVPCLKDNFPFNTKIYRFQFQVPKPFTGLHRTNLSSRAYDINTNVTKDVILYKYENPRFFQILNIFDAPMQQTEGQELKWFERINLGENKYRNGITAMSFLIGFGILTAVWLFTLRSVRFLILRKGGKDVAIVTYGPFGYNRIMTVPLKSLSAQQPREMADVLLPLKVRNRSLFYVLDMKGEFKNAQLYDYTAGLHRNL